MPLRRIFLSRESQQAGPFSLDQVNEMISQGGLLSTDHAWYQGLGGWVPLPEIDGVKMRVEERAAPPPLSESTVPVGQTQGQKLLDTVSKGGQKLDAWMGSALGQGIVEKKRAFFALPWKKYFITCILLIVGVGGTIKVAPKFWSAFDSKRLAGRNSGDSKPVSPSPKPRKLPPAVASVTEIPVDKKKELAPVFPELPPDLAALSKLPAAQITEDLIAKTETVMWQKLQDSFPNTKPVTLSAKISNSGAKIIEDPRLIGFRKALADKDPELLLRNISSYWAPLRRRAYLTDDVQGILNLMERFEHGERITGSAKGDIQLMQEKYARLQKTLRESIDDLIRLARNTRFDFQLDMTDMDVFRLSPLLVILNSLPSDLGGQTHLPGVFRDLYEFSYLRGFADRQIVARQKVKSSKIASINLTQHLLIFGRSELVSLDKRSDKWPQVPDEMMIEKDRMQLSAALRMKLPQNTRSPNMIFIPPSNMEGYHSNAWDAWFSGPENSLKEIVGRHEEQARLLQESLAKGELKEPQFMEQFKAILRDAQLDIETFCLKF